MSDKASKNGAENGKQSPGNESTSKRNSGLFSFFKWLKPTPTSNSRESLNSDKANNNSSSCDSLTSLQSSGTAASFSFVDPKTYTQNFAQKNIAVNPETDTYKARLKQRDKRREKDKNLTLRKKYNLFFNRDTLLKNVTKTETTKSLPLMTKPTMKEEPRDEGFHRRTNSDSSKIKKAGAYLHVKGKRKAPQPPGNDDSSASLKRRSKRFAPPPPEAENSQIFQKNKNSTPPVYRKNSDEGSVQQKTTKFDLSFLRRPELDEDKKENKKESKTSVTRTTSKEETIGAQSIALSQSMNQVEQKQTFKTSTNEEEQKQVNLQLRTTMNEALNKVEQKQIFKTTTTKEETIKDNKLKSDEHKQINYQFKTTINESLLNKDRVQQKQTFRTTTNEETIFKLKSEDFLQKTSSQSINKIEPRETFKIETTEETTNKFKQLETNSKPSSSKEIKNSEIIANDSLKLDHGILKPMKEEENIYSECSPVVSDPSDVSKPWYKRQEMKREFFKIRHDNKYEPVEKLPEVTSSRHSLGDKKKDEKLDKKKEENKRKSGVSLLANISELDREAAEILQKEKLKNSVEMPEFMKIKNEKSEDTWVSPKRRSARDLIAKFNAITNVTKVTVNTALFGTKDSKKNYFVSSPKEMKKQQQQEALLESHKKRIELIDKKMKSSMIPLAKSESASVVKKPETPKNDRKSWNCPKCYVENEYWRIICHVCSAIKPYFDDLTSSPNLRKNDKNSPKNTETQPNQYERILERSRTQIGFSALAQFNEKTDDNAKNLDKKEEKERLKKMLIEMKNSLPKKNLSRKLAAARASIIVEKPEMEVKKLEISDTESSDSDNEEVECSKELKKEVTEEKVASILIATKSTIYENVKMRKTSDPKPSKVSSSVQTSSVITKAPEPSKRVNVTAMVKKKNSFEPMKMEDFEDIYGDRDGKTAAKIYANLAQNDELSLFFNMPKNLTEMKNTLSKMKLQNRNQDTIEINRLLRRLEVAIGKGDMTQAADFAKELAQLKVNCSVIRQRSNSEEKDVDKDSFSVDMYVEDKISHRGPFPLQVKPEQTVGELKIQVEKEFEIPINVQRWILGKELVTDDSTTLKTNNITNGCPVFLYLVAPETPVLKNINQNDQPSTSSAKPEEKIETTPKLYPNLSMSGIYTETPTTNGPKIIDAIPKIVENNTSKIEEFKPEKHLFNEVVTQTVTTVLYAPNSHLAQPEDVEEYDTKTLKPQTKNDEWECHLCTLLNPIKSNICAVCATVRQNAPIKVERNKKPKPNAPPETSGQTYLQLMNLDNEDLVQNSEPFECLVCFTEIPKNEGVILRECLHQFCKECLRHNVEFCEEAEVKCPYRDNEYSCNIALQDREIKALVTKQIYDQHLAKSMAQAENQIDKSFHCKTPDCRGWCIFEDNVNEFKCPVCKRINCLTCQAIHMGFNCKQYQERMTEESECDENARQTRKMLNEMVEKGEALKCPTCQVIMMKKWGCDWLRCSVCKTEICWVTRGPRWGPAGKGDISGGCQCGVNGVKCHPKCNYCH